MGGGVDEMQEDPVAVEARGHVDVVVGTAYRDCTCSGMAAEERHDLPHRHEEGGAGPDRVGSRIALTCQRFPKKSAQVAISRRSL